MLYKWKDQAEFLRLQGGRWKYARIVNWVGSGQGAGIVTQLLSLQQSTRQSLARLKQWPPYPQPETRPPGDFVFRNLTHLEVTNPSSPPEWSGWNVAWTFVVVPIISQLRNLAHLTLKSIPFAEAHSELLAEHTTTKKREVYTFPSLLILQMEMTEGRAMAVLGMMDLPALISLGLWEMKGYLNARLSGIEPKVPDAAYPIRLPAVKRLLLYNPLDSHPTITSDNLICSAPSLTHLVLLHSGAAVRLGWLNLRTLGGTEGEDGGALCPGLEDLSIYDAGVELEDLKSLIKSRQSKLKRIRLGRGMVEGLESTEEVKIEEAESFAPPFDLEMLRVSPRSLVDRLKL